MSDRIRDLSESQALKIVEAIRWPDGPVCPHCGSARAYKLKANKKKRIRTGLYKCAACRKAFTVTIGTVMEGSNLSVKKWLYGMCLVCFNEIETKSHFKIKLKVVYEAALRLYGKIVNTAAYANPQRFKEAIENCFEGRPINFKIAFDSVDNALSDCETEYNGDDEKEWLKSEIKKTERDLATLKLALKFFEMKK